MTPATVDPVLVPRVARVCAVVVAVAVVPACGRDSHPVSTTSTTSPSHAHPVETSIPSVVPTGPFAAVTRLVNDAIGAHRLPGAVIQVGHGGTIAFRQAYGARRLADEPALDGSTAPAEPMTDDTIFDLASMTKPLATTVAVLQLYEQGLVQIDEAVQTYFPEFNSGNDPRRAQVTLRMLLTHTSGTGGDLSHQGPWGLTAADKAEGIHRALTAPLEFGPAEGFHYSDLNFIILGALVEKLTGEDLDVYVQDNVFGPLNLSNTRYLPAVKACGPHQIRGTAIVSTGGHAEACTAGTWSTSLLTRIAPTAHDDDSPGINPDYDQLLRGTVHDPTARRMGGVAGSAGVFSTVDDLGRYAQALLDRLAGRPSAFPLKQSTLELITTPQQPGHTPGQVEAANKASRVPPNYPAIAGQQLRGFGWDIDTEHSRPRGMVFPIGSFGHTGFTGVTLWMDPGSNTYVVVLANVIHQRGGPPIVTLSGDIATEAARALRLYGS